MKNLTKEQSKIGITAQTTSDEMAYIDKKRCYKKRASPDLSKMKSKKINNRTIVFSSDSVLLERTENLISQSLI